MKITSETSVKQVSDSAMQLAPVIPRMVEPQTDKRTVEDVIFQKPPTPLSGDIEVANQAYTAHKKRLESAEERRRKMFVRKHYGWQLR